MRPDRVGGLTGAALLAACAVLTGMPAHAQSAPVELCTVEDGELSELSGLASDGANWYAVGDGGSSVQAFVLDPASCEVRSQRTGSNNPYDVEDLALAPDGSLWLADTGDNRHNRKNVALHVLPAGGGAAMYRLSYPDSPHDAEALLLDRAGVPHIVTKEPLGWAGIYRPARPLDPNETVPMERVGSVSLRATKTPGGPLDGSMGSVLVTGGSVSQDGTLVALRTYTEAYVYRSPNGDVLEALKGEPVRIPLPDEEQGEAIAWEPGGSLLSGSEGNEPIRRVSGADGSPSAETTGQPAPGGDADQAQPATEEDGTSTGRALLFAGVIAALLVYFIGWRRRKA
ncbi:SdiA-regulated/phytase-like domain-containing protein [Saccharopolyspora mangrovi]|uniref:Esterase-like activity of phytase family protein n=1 Tax=Saccharopolyspora mangrovi TaxID=3082379 RepID=A0ABU6AA73_9PSEU|nr:hypothetical protein [Saccharopolyspora sp. S2-29]MEB3368472.1 hypothetical protein [Saccharopolyspora sp. S2-29]